MKVSDFIVEYLIAKGVTDVFGYPGGMVTHLMDSLGSRRHEIRTHLNYHEQASAFSACGFAQATNRLGVAFATSGPGATNLITGICNAYYDSIPVLFITGQVNTSESAKGTRQRQRGFQETDIVSMVCNVTKYAAYVESPDKIRLHLENAIHSATTGRFGAALLDIPMDVMRGELLEESKQPSFVVTNRAFHENDDFAGYGRKSKSTCDREIEDSILQRITKARRPVLLYGQGIKAADCVSVARAFAEKHKIPVVTSMPAQDIMGDSPMNYGFVGAYGTRCANFIVAKSDLVISVGSRMDIRQVGKNRAQFAPNAQIIRIDIDENELVYPVHKDEISICMCAADFFHEIAEKIHESNTADWLSVCSYLRERLKGIDDMKPNWIIERIMEQLPDDAIIATDVGQNQVWVSQAAGKRSVKKILYSASMGAMGYSLPAAIGACLATGKPVYAFMGDGGFQMNMQELQTVVRENLPVHIILLNNHALGMIRHFQEMYFEKREFMTVTRQGYTNPSFIKIASAYGLPYCQIKSEETPDMSRYYCITKHNSITEVMLDEDTYVFPKLEFGKPNQDQSPQLDRLLYHELMDDEALCRNLSAYNKKNEREN